MVDSTLVIHWLFSWLAVLLMMTRIVWRRLSTKEFNAGDYLTMAALVCVCTRMGLIHVVLTWGTNNLSAAYRLNLVFTSEEIYQRTVGSKFTVINRFFYNTYLWLQKLVLLDVYRQILRNLHWERLILTSYFAILALTYVIVQVFNISECKPVYLYWQVDPNPGSCVQAKLQLVVLGVLNIVTDLMLLILPFPLVIMVRTPWQRKAQLSSLFILGIFVIAITVIRLPINSSNISSQVNRSTWASVELLTAAIVVNASTLFSLWNKNRKEKSQESLAGGTGVTPRYHYGQGISTTNISARKKTNIIVEDEHGLISMHGIRHTYEVTVSESALAFREAGSKGSLYKVLPEDLAKPASPRDKLGS